jgi:hypothetical protein
MVRLVNIRLGSTAKCVRISLKTGKFTLRYFTGVVPGISSRVHMA